MRAWRSLIELRIDDALATVAQFEDEIARADAPVAPRSREFAEVLRAVLLVLKSQDGATVRAALAVLESRHRSGGKSPALAAALRVGYWKVRDFDRYYAVPRLNHAVPTHRGTHGLATIIGPTFEAVVEAEQLRLAVATRLARSAHERAVSRFGKRSPVTARAAVVLAELLYEEGHRAGLDALVMESLTAVRTSGDEESALRGYRVLARLAARRGDTEFAFLILKEAEVLAAARDWTGMMAESLMLRTQLLLKEGRTRDAAICTERIETLARDHRSPRTTRCMPAMPWHMHRYWSPPGTRAEERRFSGSFKRRAAASETTTGHCDCRFSWPTLCSGAETKPKAVRCSFKRFRLARAPGCIRHSSMPERTWPSSCCPFTTPPRRTAACPRSSDPTSEAFSRTVLSSVHARCRLVPRASRSR